MISILVPLSGSFDRPIDLILSSLGFFLKLLSYPKFISCHFRYMPSNTRSNKEIKLLISSDPASLERLIRKGICSSSIDNTCSSLDFCQPPLTHTPVSSTDTRSPPSTEDTLLPSTNIFHPMSIDT